MEEKGRDVSRWGRKVFVCGREGMYVNYDGGWKLGEVRQLCKCGWKMKEMC